MSFDDLHFWVYNQEFLVCCRYETQRNGRHTLNLDCVVPAWSWEDRSACRKLYCPDHVLAWPSSWDFLGMEVFSLCPWQTNTENGKMPRRFLPGAGTVFFQSLTGWMLMQGWRTVVIVLREIMTITTVGNRKRKIELGMGPCRKLCFQDRLEPKRSLGKL